MSFQVSDIILSLSDFDAALGRARVPAIPESPSRSTMFDLDLSDNEASPTSLEGRFDFPCTPVSDDLSKQFLTMEPEEEDKMMKAAASEIAKSLDLQVGLGHRKLCLYFVSFLLACTLILRLNCERSKIWGLLTRLTGYQVFAAHHSAEELCRLVFYKRKCGLSAQQV